MQVWFFFFENCTWTTGKIHTIQISFQLEDSLRELWWFHRKMQSKLLLYGVEKRNETFALDQWHRPNHRWIISENEHENNIIDQSIHLWRCILWSIYTLPIASKPLSNNNKTPRNRKAIPNPANPTPISELNSERNKLKSQTDPSNIKDLLWVSVMSNIFDWFC